MEDLLRLLVESEGRTITLSTFNHLRIGKLTISDGSLSTIYDTILSNEQKYGHLNHEISETIDWIGGFAYGQGNFAIGDYSYAIGADAVYTGNGTLVTREWINENDEIIRYE